MSDGVKRFWEEVKQEGKRLGVQGAAEIASALFTGQSYVPYGSGQSVDIKENDGVQPMPTQQVEQEQGREM